MKKVRIFTTNMCPWCRRTKEFLKENNVEFEEINVERDREMAVKMISVSGRNGVPQLWIGDEIIIGFDKAKIKVLLDL